MSSIKTETLFSNQIDKWWDYYNCLPKEKTGFYHQPDFLFFQEKAGFGTAFLQIFYDGDDLVYYPGLLRPLPFNKKGFDIDSSWYYGGPLASWSSWFPLDKYWLKEIENARRELNAITEFIRFDPNLENHILLEGPWPVEYNRETFIVNLGTKWENIWKHFSSQNRRNVKKAKKNNLSVKKGSSPPDWEAFVHIYNEEMIRKNAPEHLRFDAFFFKELQLLPNIGLFLIRRKNDIIGGFVSAAGKSVAHHFLSATKNEFWDLRPNNLLFTEVIKYYHNAGYEKFDFQGGRAGVARFKSNFSDQRGSFFIGKKILNQKKYDEFSYNKDTDFFPSYRENL